jgi:hypothetical protein
MANARPFAVLPWVLRCLEGRFYKKKSQRAGCGHWRSRAVRYISDYFTCAIIPDADLRAVRLRVKARLTPPDPPALRLRVKARLTPVTRASRPRAPRRSGAAAGPMEHAAHGPVRRPRGARAPGGEPAGTTARPVGLEPWLSRLELSSCRGSVEPLSRPLSRPCLSSLVEPVEFCAGLSRSVELSSFCRVSLSRLSSL